MGRGSLGWLSLHWNEAVDTDYLGRYTHASEEKLMLAEQLEGHAGPAWLRHLHPTSEILLRSPPRLVAMASAGVAPD